MTLYIDVNDNIRSGANDATRATNKQYALQKSSYCPIHLSFMKWKKWYCILKIHMVHAFSIQLFK